MSTPAPTAAPGVKFKKKKVLTRPVLKLVENEPIYVKLVGPMHLGKEMKQKEGEKKKDPATLIDVINLSTGEEAQIIASAVIKSVLDELYPNQSYVGLGFSMVKQARQPGKQYNPVHIEEIELPAEETPASDGASAPGAEAPAAPESEGHAPEARSRRR